MSERNRWAPNYKDVNTEVHPGNGNANHVIDPEVVELRRAGLVLDQERVELARADSSVDPADPEVRVSRIRSELLEGISGTNRNISIPKSKYW